MRGTRCTGDCCRRYYLPFSSEEMTKFAEYARMDAAGEKPDPLPDDWMIWSEIAQIAEMSVLVRNDPDGSHRYRCTNLGESGDCTIYETRPKMCSGYPYGKDCSFAGCNWEAVRPMGPHGDLLIELGQPPLEKSVETE